MKSTRDDPDVGRFPQPFVFSTADEKTKVSVRDDFYYDEDPLYTALKDKFDIQSGSNADGSWIKLPDGTLIQHGRVSESVPAIATNEWRASSVHNFPIAFVGNIPTLTVCHEGDAGGYVLIEKVYPGLTAWSVQFIPTPADTTAYSDMLNYIAIGRWKA